VPLETLPTDIQNVWLVQLIPTRALLVGGVGTTLQLLPFHSSAPESPEAMQNVAIGQLIPSTTSAPPTLGAFTSVQ
jgi:hypothetical protein